MRDRGWYTGQGVGVEVDACQGRWQGPLSDGRYVVLILILILILINTGQ